MVGSPRVESGWMVVGRALPLVVVALVMVGSPRVESGRMVVGRAYGSLHRSLPIGRWW